MNLEIVKTLVIEIPLIQIGILAGLCTIFALRGMFKIMLVCVYGFILYWVFFLNEAKFSFTRETEVLHAGLFIVASIIFVGCCAWVILMEK